jgi:hypothetical protein
MRIEPSPRDPHGLLFPVEGAKVRSYFVNDEVTELMDATLRLDREDSQALLAYVSEFGLPEYDKTARERGYHVSHVRHFVWAIQYHAKWLAALLAALNGVGPWKHPDIPDLAEAARGLQSIKIPLRMSDAERARLHRQVFAIRVAKQVFEDGSRDGMLMQLAVGANPEWSAGGTEGAFVPIITAHTPWQVLQLTLWEWAAGWTTLRRCDACGRFYKVTRNDKKNCGKACQRVSAMRALRAKRRQIKERRAAGRKKSRRT